MGRLLPLYCEECGKLFDAGDFGGKEECECADAFGPYKVIGKVELATDTTIDTDRPVIQMPYEREIELLRKIEALSIDRDRYRDALAGTKWPLDRWGDEECPTCSTPNRDDHVDGCLWIRAVNERET